MTPHDTDHARLAARCRDAGLGRASIDFLLSRAQPRLGGRAVITRSHHSPVCPAIHTHNTSMRPQPVLASVYGLADLWEASPCRLFCDEPYTDAIIDAFCVRDGSITVASTNPDAPITTPREALRGTTAGYAWIWTEHAFAEITVGDIDLQARSLRDLGEILPLVLAYRTHESALCGWFDAPTADSDRLNKWRRRATQLGATCHCPLGLSVPVQMPDGIIVGTNDRARVFFFAPKTSEKT